LAEYREGGQKKLQKKESSIDGFLCKLREEQLLALHTSGDSRHSRITQDVKKGGFMESRGDLRES